MDVVIVLLGSSLVWSNWSLKMMMPFCLLLNYCYCGVHIYTNKRTVAAAAAAVAGYYAFTVLEEEEEEDEEELCALT